MFKCTTWKKPVVNYFWMIDQVMFQNQKNYNKCFYSKSSTTVKPVLLIHGGAGDIVEGRVKGKVEGMKKALRCAKEHLWPSEGCKTSALDAVEAAIREMEEDENFNAGYGSCLNRDGQVELEAGLMEGKELKAGCISLLNDILHPISVARCVMEKTKHTFLGGGGAQKFALDQGFEQLAAGALVTEGAVLTFKEFQELQRKGIDTTYLRTETIAPSEHGTVGAVAIDTKGNLAVGTSTGGLTGKQPGRIGDVSLLGCGTYADNKMGAVSATGHGETIMRFNLAYYILTKIRYENKTPQKAVEEACKEMTKRLTGTAGAIVIDKKGQIGMYWTTSRMAWGYTDGKNIVCGVDQKNKFTDVL